ncbi:TetR/AcrR family transcriptional regulator [Amycolatopsis rhabdoformis]|uniref:TetR/AcrR family transcriptional regulator n=1 Tax=Amycolatopsis rhabdoformis TaxID=1448059 RepID=A0ABZ1IJB0_9PSEU|nr:TetR/AcrR family transcriptional regulator [Amycolatopsis rhabdoformis]WSE34486.1 TetR/AcrR family transcriptional regulator [Amycolatopsis rhabdoformis]
MPRPSVEAQRREQILRAACEVLSDQGLHEFRLADVARRAGVSSGTIHYYFDGKRAVLSAAFEHNYRLSISRRRELTAEGGRPMAALRELVEAFLPRRAEALTAWRVWAELWAEAMRDEQFQAINETLYGQWRRLVTDLIAQAQADGSARAGDPAALANMLVAMIDGLAVQVLAGSREMTADRMRRTVLQFLDGCVAA